MRNDRLLTGILIAIGLLALVAVMVFFVRRNNLDYGPESQPDGVVRNYVLAIQKDDLDRAYSYLAPVEGRPDPAAFRASFLRRSSQPDWPSVQILSVRSAGTEASVDLVLVHPTGDLFSEGWNEEAAAVLALDPDGAWKITSMPYPYWDPAWFPALTPAPVKLP